jgi:hypothetical protein
MRLDELKQPNKEITQAYLNYMFKAARSELAKTDKSGNVKRDDQGVVKTQSKPLSPEYGERKALRGDPTPENPIGPILGSGGPMHKPISPKDAFREIKRIKSKMDTGQSLPYSQLKPQGDSFDAVTMRNKRSAPGRPAVWPNGAKWDKDGPYYGMNRAVIAPDGSRKVTRDKPAPRAKPGQRSTLTTGPQAKRRYRRVKFKSPHRGPRGKGVSRTLSNSKNHISEVVNEDFVKFLDIALGL